VLELTNVTKRYGEMVAVDNLSMKVEPGTIAAIIGPNGAGKSTTFRLISGLLYSDEGNILWGDQELSRALPAERRSFLPEECGLYQSVQVEHLLRYWARLRNVDRSAISTVVDRWISRFELGSKRHSPVRTLSKGNQQKVQLAACLLHSPDLIVFDEPFSGLDPSNQDLVSEILRGQALRGAAILISAHQLGLVERLADIVILMRAGQAVEMPGFGRSAGQKLSSGSRTVRVLTHPGVSLDTQVLPPHRASCLENDQVLITFPSLTARAFTDCLAVLAAMEGVVDLDFSEPDLHRTYVRWLSTGPEGVSDGSPRS